MSHSKNCTGFLNSSLHINAVFHAGCHRLLAEDVVTLLCKRQGNLEMEVILDGDENSISQALANGTYCFRGGSVEILPIIKDKSLVHLVQFREKFLRLGTWFGDSNNLAAFGVV